MGFSTVCATNAQRVAAEELKEALHEPRYRLNPYQVWDNMDLDRQTPDLPVSATRAGRKDLIDAIADQPGLDAVGKRRAAEEFCLAHCREGDEDDRAAGALVGHVHRTRALERHLRGPSSQAGAGDIRRLVYGLVHGDPHARLARQKRQLGAQPLSRYQMWSCYALAGDAPFEGMPGRRETVDRLGLGFYEGTDEELVRWTHRLASGTIAHKPTAWDAGVGNPCWRPGGFTEPLTGTYGRGRPEVVHKPISAAELVTPMEPLED